MHQSSRRYRVGVVGAVLWTALILGLYYWAHKPLNEPLVRALGGALLDAGSAALLVTSGGAIGRRLLRGLAWSRLSAAEQIALPALIGLGVLALLVFVVGAITLSRAGIGALVVLLLILCRGDAIAWGRDVRDGWRGGFRGGGSAWTRFLAWSALILVGMALTLATLPPVKWDVLTYHLVGPEAYVEHGRFYTVPHNHFLGFPQLLETLFAAQYALTHQLTSGGLLHGLIGVLALLLTGGYAARHAGAAAGRLAVIALLASRTIWLEFTFAYVDLMLMGLAAAGLIVVELWEGEKQKHFTTESTEDGRAPCVGAIHESSLRESPLHSPKSSVSMARRLSSRRETPYLILLGAVLGFAGGTKYTAIHLGVAFAVLLLWLSRRDGVRAIRRRGLIVGGTAALVILPWLARNAVWYDNPIYPFVFDGAEMDSLRQEWYTQPGSGLLASPEKAWMVPILPLSATVLGFENAGLFAADVGPLFALLVPLLALVWSHLTADERRVIARALLLAGVMTLTWTVAAGFGSYMNAQTRLVLYVFPPLAVVAGITVEALRRLPDKPLNLGFVLRAMVALVVVFTLMDGARLWLRSGLHVYYSGEKTYRADFLDYALGWHSEAMRQVNALDADVRFLWEPRTLYCDGHCRPDSLMDSWYHARRTLGDPARIAAAWRTGEPYLLVYEFGRTYERDHNDLYDRADWDAWDTFTRRYLEEVWRGESAEGEAQYILYRWRAGP